MSVPSSQKPEKQVLNKLETIALSVTRGIGSVWSVAIHTLLFTLTFGLIFLGFNIDRVLLTLTTILSLEAIYLSIFIQMSVNFQTRIIASVEKEIDEIAEDVEEMQEDMEEIAEDVEEMQENIDEIQEDVQEIAEDVEEIQEDVEEIQEEYTEEEILDSVLDNKLSNDVRK